MRCSLGFLPFRRYKVTKKMGECKGKMSICQFVNLSFRIFLCHLQSRDYNALKNIYNIIYYIIYIL